MSARAALLVEGESDREALLALAPRLGIDLPKHGVEVQVLGGIHALRPYLKARRDRGDRTPVTGLYDAAEERIVRRALADAGVGDAADRRELESHGFFCCEADLEDELIRGLGPPAVRAVIAQHGEEAPLHGLQQQPQWRGRPIEAQLHRFFGSGARRKISYGRWLAEAVELERVPRPLLAVLEAAVASAG